MRNSNALAGAMAALLMLGCTSGSPQTPSPSIQTTQTYSPEAERTTVTGTVEAPAGTSGQGSAALVPLAGATVTIVDQSLTPLPGVQTATTDANGHFTLSSVPDDFNWIIQVQGGGRQLGAIVAVQAATPLVMIDPASTLVTAHVLQGFTQKTLTLPQVSSAHFAHLAQLVKQQLVSASTPPDLSSATTEESAFEQLAQANASIASEATILNNPASASSGGNTAVIGPNGQLIGGNAPPAFDAASKAMNLSTFAGQAVAGSTNGPAASALFNGPAGMVYGPDGSLYLADTKNNLIRKIDINNNVFTFAGTGHAGYADGAGASAMFAAPTGLAMDRNQVLYVADSGNNRIRLISPDGTVSTYAGTGAKPESDGAALQAAIVNPCGLTVAADGTLYVADRAANTIRKISTSGVVTTLAGSATAGTSDGTGAKAQFNSPSGIAMDASGNLWVADSGNARIRMVTAAGIVTTVAGGSLPGFQDGKGTQALFNQPSGIVIDSQGNILVADSGNNCIRKIASDGTVTTYAGDTTAGHTDAGADAGELYGPSGLVFTPTGGLMIADTLNNVLRLLK